MEFNVDDICTPEEKIVEPRMAKCAWCGKKTISKDSLPWFNEKPEKEFDEYYCGCGGWD